MCKKLLILVILCLNVPSLFAQTSEPENALKPPTQSYSETVDTSEPQPSSDTSEPQPSSSAVEPWHGNRRILKVVNDYRLAVDEVITTLVIVAGNAKVHGTVTGNVLVIGGCVELAPEAEIKGAVHVIGGSAIDKKGGEDISLGGTSPNSNLYIYNGWHIVPATAHLLMHPHTIWGVNKQYSRWLTIGKFVLFLFIYLLLAFIFSKQLNELESMMSEHPIRTVLYGMLMLVLIPVSIGVLIFSIVGLPCLLLGLAFLFPVAIYGKAAIFLLIGRTLLSGRFKPIAVIFGYILYFMAISVPYIDWGTFLGVNAIAIGGCVRSVFSRKPRQSPLRNTYLHRSVTR